MRIPINPKRLDDGDGTVQTFIDNNACYHLSCKLSFNNLQLERAQDKCNKKMCRLESTSEETRHKRNRLEKKNIPFCFICELKDDINNLHNVETFNFCEKLKEIASELNDTKLLKSYHL